MSHYLLEKSATGKDSPYTAFFYPHHMFHNARVTLNTLVSLEDAFIAAYLVGVRNFSSADLRVTAARIMGIRRPPHAGACRRTRRRLGDRADRACGGHQGVAIVGRQTTATSARSAHRHQPGR
jgi:hypothetical protein